jgi:PIN domain nuclease of toxin-antitoxin system
LKFLLDTCTFLWIVGGSRTLPSTVRALLQAPDNDVYLSSASAWEIAIKHASGRMPLPDRPERLVPSERERLGVSALPFDEESALHATRLPSLHRDPFDRMLVSQAIVHGLVIVTPDEMIARYPARVLW